MVNGGLIDNAQLHTGERECSSRLQFVNQLSYFGRGQLFMVHCSNSRSRGGSGILSARRHMNKLVPLEKIERGLQMSDLDKLIPEPV